MCRDEGPGLSLDELREFLDAKVLEFNTPAFIPGDPVSIPHRYRRKEDIEISGFLAATIAWGNRGMIVRNGHRMMDMLGDSPFDFVLHHRDRHLGRLETFVHRTFNATDMVFFIKALHNLYVNGPGLEGIFARHQEENSLQNAIHVLHEYFFELPHPARTRKHVADPAAGSAAKRINMFLRWMVRKDSAGVDFGIWDSISPAKLSCPLDLHSGRVARMLGLLTRRQNDHKAVLELDASLRKFDPHDPARYDFALFGLGIRFGREKYKLQSTKYKERSTNESGK
jgi:uncharacterized protein (TIGR02757 family)